MWWLNYVLAVSSCSSSHQKRKRDLAQMKHTIQMVISIASLVTTTLMLLLLVESLEPSRLSLLFYQFGGHAGEKFDGKE
jgi:hypothetical protein